jgi:hypothetical protein
MPFHDRFNNLEKKVWAHRFNNLKKNSSSTGILVAVMSL